MTAKYICHGEITSISLHQLDDGKLMIYCQLCHNTATCHLAICTPLLYCTTQLYKCSTCTQTFLRFRQDKTMSFAKHQKIQPEYQSFTFKAFSQSQFSVIIRLFIALLWRINFTWYWDSRRSKPLVHSPKITFKS